MNIPNELVTEWFLAAQEQSTVTKSEYIAQRAAEWALQQPVSMEPVAWTGTRASIPHLTSSRAIAEREADLYTIPLYTATQLAAARQQGAEEERKKLADRERMLTDEELADPVYMKAYIQEGNDTISDLLTANKRDKEARQQRIAELQDENQLLRRADEERQKCMVKMQADAVKYEDDIANLHTVMMAAAVEITEHWGAHCDSEGYGPSNLVRRLENGYPSQYGYDADTVVRQDKRIADLEKSNAVLLEALKYHQEQTRPIQRTIDAIQAAEVKP